MKSKLKKGDKVIVISGEDKKKQGKILQVLRKDNRVIVEGINMISKHQKQSREDQKGGIIKKEAPISASNVMLVVNGKRTRVGYKMEDDKKVRIAKSTSSKID